MYTPLVPELAALTEDECAALRLAVLDGRTDLKLDPVAADREVQRLADWVMRVRDHYVFSCWVTRGRMAAYVDENWKLQVRPMVEHPDPTVNWPQAPQTVNLTVKPSQIEHHFTGDFLGAIDGNI